MSIGTETKTRPSPALLQCGLWMAGALFLFNPNVNILDVLPDCIGYLLLLLGVRRAAHVLPYFDDAARYFRYLAILTATRIPAYFVMTSLAAGDNEQRVIITLFSLCYGIGELLLLFPAFRALFAGTEYLAERYGVRAAGTPAASLAARVTLFALAAKPVLAFLPELCWLSSENAGYVDGRLSVVTPYPYFVVAACVLGLLAGAAFLCTFLPFCRALRADPGLAALSQKLLPDDGAAAALRGADRIRRVTWGGRLLTIGAFCLIDLVFDEINYLPDFLGAICFLLAALCFLPLARRRAVFAAVAAGVYLPLSVARYILSARFYALYSYAAFGRVKAADRLYTALSITAGAEVTAAVVTFAAFACLFFTVIRAETGYAHDAVNPYSSHLPLHRALRRKTAVWLALGAVACLADFADVLLRRLTARVAYGTPLPDASGVVGAGTMVLPEYGFVWLIVFGLTLFFALYTLHLAMVLSYEVTQKYALE